MTKCPICDGKAPHDAMWGCSMEPAYMEMLSVCGFGGEHNFEKLWGEFKERYFKENIHTDESINTLGGWAAYGE